jgi:hypothetical protein
MAAQLVASRVVLGSTELVSYVRTNSYKSDRRKFSHKFPETTGPSGDTMFKLVKEFEPTAF